MKLHYSLLKPTKMLTKCKNHMFLTFFQRKIYFGTRFASIKNESKGESLLSLCKLFELVD